MQTMNISHNRAGFDFEPADPSVVANGPDRVTKLEPAANQKKSRLRSLSRFSRPLFTRADDQALASPEVPSKAIESTNLMSTVFHEWELVSGHEF
jgi:hypothetical protein